MFYLDQGFHFLNWTFQSSKFHENEAKYEKHEKFESHI